MEDTTTSLAALELTHVVYNAESHVSLLMALITLSPILLMASYAALAVVTRDILVIEMWAGQLVCEALNLILKRIVKEERPPESLGQGYGFPSSHSQYMGYFSTFLIIHLWFRHRFSPSGYPILDLLFRGLVYSALVTWTAVVCYSRLHLTYHNETQILWGVGVGIAFGALTYRAVELVPRKYPNSLLGQLRVFLVGNPVSTWLEIKDGWAVHEDGGRATEWRAWRIQWERKTGYLKEKRRD